VIGIGSAEFHDTFVGVGLVFAVFVELGFEGDDKAGVDGPGGFWQYFVVAYFL
jgi:hypothetical protein